MSSEQGRSGTSQSSGCPRPSPRHSQSKRTKFCKNESCSSGSTSGILISPTPAPTTLSSFYRFNEDVSENIAVSYTEEEMGINSELRTTVLTYNELNRIINQLIHKLSIDYGITKGFIGIASQQNLLFPSLLISVLKCGGGFYSLNPNQPISEDLSALDHLNIKYILADPDYSSKELVNSEMFKNVEVLELLPNKFLNIYEYKCLPENSIGCFPNPPPPNEWAYAIKTSGTTGNQKLVLVKHSSIVPNINDFIRIWELSSNNVILGVSPSTFDPHIIELFCTLGSGAEIAYMSSYVKLNPIRLIELVKKREVSLVQCTPSFFMRLGEHSTEFLNTLSVIAFGGEPFNFKKYLRDICHNSNLKVYNLYGITELSCWSSYSRIDMQSTDDAVDLGKPLSFTEINLKNDNIVLSSSYRQTYIIFYDTGKEVQCNDFFETGDLGYLNPNASTSYPSIIFTGRNDRCIKRNGIFVDMNEIETQVLASNMFSSVHSFYDFGKVYLVVVPFNQAQKNETRNEIFNSIHNRVSEKSYPDRILILKPSDTVITENGKFDLQTLKNYVFNEQNELFKGEILDIHYSQEYIVEQLSEFWTSILRTERELQLHANFINSGGDSIKLSFFVEAAIRLFFLQQNIDTVQIIESHLKSVLSAGSFQDVVDYITKATLPHKMLMNQIDLPCTLTKDLEQEKFDQASKILSWKIPSMQDPVFNFNLKVNRAQTWKFNTGACCDSTPVIFQHPDEGPILVAASHSGIVMAINLTLLVKNQSHHLLWKIAFPDRVMTSLSAAVHPSNRMVVVACCDNNLYALDALSGQKFWQYNGKSMLRSTPVFDEAGSTVLFVSDNNELICLKSQNGLLSWRLELRDHTLLTSCSPILANTSSKTVKIFLNGWDKIISVFLHGKNKSISISPIPDKIFGNITIFNKDDTLYMVYQGVKELIIGGKYECKTETFVEIWRISKPKASIFANYPVYFNMNNDVIIAFTTCTNDSADPSSLYLVNAYTGNSLVNLSLNCQCVKQNKPEVLRSSNGQTILAILDNKGVIHFVLVENSSCVKATISSTLQLNLESNFTTFSGLAYHWSNIFAFGGRDNHLHVCKPKVPENVNSE